MFIFFITVDTHSIHEMDPVDAVIIDWAMTKKQDVPTYIVKFTRFVCMSRSLVTLSSLSGDTCGTGTTSISLDCLVTSTVVGI